VREELQNFGIYSREDGGAVPFVEISAKTKLNFDKLEAELAELSKSLNLQEDTNIHAQAFVIESKSTKNSTYVNPCASLIIRKGVLKEGEAFICGDTFGRIRHINDEFGVSKKEAFPGQAVEAVGFRASPAAGSILTVIEDIKLAEKLISDRRKMREFLEAKERENVGKGIKLGKLKRKERHLIMKKGDLEAISNKIQSVLSEGKNENLDEKQIREVYLREGFVKKKIIIRADTLGLLESIEDELLRNFSEKTLDEVIIDSGVGSLTEDDFKYAKNSNAIFFCFNMDQEVDDYAISYGVGVRKHKLIYNIIEEVHYFINEANLVDPSIENSENFFKGRAVVKDMFKIKVNSKISFFDFFFIEKIYKQ
jgi:translation initiation factor IF-2